MKTSGFINDDDDDDDNEGFDIVISEEVTRDINLCRLHFLSSFSAHIVKPSLYFRLKYLNNYLDLLPEYLLQIFKIRRK